MTVPEREGARLGLGGTRAWGVRAALWARSCLLLPKIALQPCQNKGGSCCC